MADNFGLKIGVEGEKEFKNALREINQTFKVLGSEMNLVSSQFEKQDKSIAAVTSRNEVLNKSIDTQKEKITTLEKALQNATDSFGENDRRTQSWVVQLNNAKPTRNATGFGRSGEWSVQKPILSGDGKMVVQCQRWAVSDYSEPVSYALSPNGVLKSSISWSDSGNYQYPAAKPGALSDDGKILVLTPNAAKILSYDLVSGAWVARPDPASLPTGACSSCALSADGIILAVWVVRTRVLRLEDK